MVPGPDSERGFPCPLIPVPRPRFYPLQIPEIFRGVSRKPY